MRFLILGFMLLISLLTNQLKAQSSRGDLLIGGSVSGQFLRPERIYIVDISPAIGLFLKDKWLIGGSVQLGMARFGPTNRYASLKMLPMARYYLKQHEESSIFLQADAGYHRIQTNLKDAAFTKSGLGGGGAMGMAYFLNKIVSIEGLLKLSAFMYTNGSISIQPEVRLGILLYLPSPRRNF